ncbi:hypothetical protein K469DRAFT_704998 [Zopfia rhizophila CBS 207.26]|uniref:Secreted protein n=1 Tax=Zopfia rhizophila CBS 207.26 TaxID=1314779 RepID=A0A6A6E5T8_9PEZI|nr:hypothetical protein K469DRAFT_704998 [Zopfia rhizophila CBS 207.26]
MCSAFLLTALLLQGEQCLMGLRPLVLYYLAFGSASTTISTGESDVLYWRAMCSIVRSLLCFDYHIDWGERCALLSAF